MMYILLFGARISYIIYLPLMTGCEEIIWKRAFKHIHFFVHLDKLQNV